MLSRVADSLFWIGRYIERAENISRIVEVHLQLALDFQADEKNLWGAIIQATGDEELFSSLYEEVDEKSVIEYLTYNKKNLDSIICCLCGARENARMVRDQITTELWEEINRLYLDIHSKSMLRNWKSHPYEFYADIRRTSLLIQGLISATIRYDEGHEFLSVGKYLERADKTSRILDMKYYVLLPKVSDIGGAVDKVQWGAVLRCCSAYDVYRRQYVSEIDPRLVSELLIFSEDFPRSLKWCLKSLDHSLREISGTEEGHFSNEAEKQTGRLLAKLNYSSVEDVYGIGLHEFLDSIQKDLNGISDALYQSTLFVPPVDIETEVGLQQQQQQQ